LKDANPEDVFIQQVVYGFQKEKPLLKKFIDDFYGDNSARVLRADMVMYNILAYIAIFRIDELGVKKFKEVTSPVEPSKLSTLIAYVFNEVLFQDLFRNSVHFSTIG
jgi:hypothetical protein